VAPSPGPLESERALRALAAERDLAAERASARRRRCGRSRLRLAPLRVRLDGESQRGLPWMHARLFLKTRLFLERFVKIRFVKIRFVKIRFLKTAF
jgi:hypothetical protein